MAFGAGIGNILKNLARKLDNDNPDPRQLADFTKSVNHLRRAGGGNGDQISTKIMRRPRLRKFVHEGETNRPATGLARLGRRASTDIGYNRLESAQKAMQLGGTGCASLPAGLDPALRSRRINHR